jgi:hypothetical protein
VKSFHPDAQWFEPLGRCNGCDKPATGILRGYRNDNRGVYCQKCADAAIKAAHKLGKHEPDYVHEFRRIGEGEK